MAHDDEEFSEAGVVLVCYAHELVETDKALLFEFADGEEVWIPKSQITAREGAADGGYIEIPLWLAQKKGLSY